MDGKTLTVPEVDENGTYLIRTGAELAWFAAEVNRGTVKLTEGLKNYIYLNDFNTTHKWTMIGDTEANPYRGDFDGNGQKIVYMRAEITHKDPGRRYAGLFGVIDGGTVRNVTVLGKVIQGYGNYGLVGGSDQFCAGSGGIAGYLKNGQIINCTNYARTTMDGDAMYRNSGGLWESAEALLSTVPMKGNCPPSSVSPKIISAELPDLFTGKRPGGELCQQCRPRVISVWAVLQAP